MKEAFDDNWRSDKLDPVDAPDQDFDWQALYQRVNEDAASGENDPRLSQVVLGILQLLLPPSNRRLQPESLGLRLIALAWVLSPAYFEGTPSIRRLAKRCGIRIAALANYTGYYSRLLGWRNRGQRHAWNWLQNGTPAHRGEKPRRKLKRNVPASGGRKENDSPGHPQAGASSGESASGRKPKVVAPSPK
ncbi:MAG: hypothetical protein KJ072_25210 [Verrucomicrobia bacterium]|nr:hypothetical protein [Verrucomicrobiota bacterium]